MNPGETRLFVESQKRGGPDWCEHQYARGACQRCNERLRRELSEASTRIKDLEAKLAERDDLLEAAWGVIATAPGWRGSEDKEWRAVAERWRDLWHKTLPTVINPNECSPQPTQDRNEKLTADQYTGRRVDEAQVQAWMYRIKVSGVIHLKGEECVVESFSARTVTLRLLTTDERMARLRLEIDEITDGPPEPVAEK